MVVSTGREKRCLLPEFLRELKPQHIAIKRDRSLKVRDLQMHMP
jgi:hypothetical protein